MSAVPARPRYRAADPRRRAIAWSAVAAVHVVIGWALVSGTARQRVEPARKPLQASVIQEVVIPPPPPAPPPPPPPPPRRIERVRPRIVPVAPPPPPVFVPPPEVAAAPPSPAAVAVPSVATPPPAPAPSPAPAPAPAAPATAGPSRAEIGVACPKQVKPEMPRRAVEDNIEGTVRAQALIRDGEVRQVTILSGPRVYHAAVRAAMLQYKCVSGPGDVLVTQEFVFKFE